MRDRSHDAEYAPRYREGSANRKQRRCLMCGEMFSSAGPQNRICQRHQDQRKRTKYEDWAGGLDGDLLSENSRDWVEEC